MDAIVGHSGHVGVGSAHGVDVVGTAFGLEALGTEEWRVTDDDVGGGPWVGKKVVTPLRPSP